MGKHEKLWRATREEWLRANPPNHQGYYICYLCKAWIPKNEITIDHVKSRSRYPELRYELSNLAPCCGKCNFDKGSTEYKPIERKPRAHDTLFGIW